MSILTISFRVRYHDELHEEIVVLCVHLPPAGLTRRRLRRLQFHVHVVKINLTHLLFANFKFSKLFFMLHRAP
jgi:hypothetical protein